MHKSQVIVGQKVRYQFSPSYGRGIFGVITEVIDTEDGLIFKVRYKDGQTYTYSDISLPQFTAVN